MIAGSKSILVKQTEKAWFQPVVVLVVTVPLVYIHKVVYQSVIFIDIIM